MLWLIPALAAAAVALLIPSGAGAQGPPPPNDNFSASAQLLPWQKGTTSESTADATGEATDPVIYDVSGARAGGTMYRSVWFSWTPATNVHEAFDTVGSNFDTIMAIYTDPVGSLAQVAENDECQNALTSIACFDFNATAGTTYYIQVVGTHMGQGGDLVLNWSSLPPPAPTIDPAVLAALTSTPQPTNQVTIPFSDPDAAMFVCTIDNQDSTGCSSPYTTPPLSDGAHTVSVQGITAALYPSSNATVSFTVATAPTITSSPPLTSNTSAASFTFVPNGFAALIAASYVCTLDTVVINPCSSPQSFSTLPDGPHTFTVRMVDGAGNIGNPATYAWTIDTSTPPPAPTLGSTPAGTTTGTSGAFTFSDSAPNVTFYCSLDGAFPASLCTSPQSYPGPLGFTGHTFSVYAQSATGRRSTPTTFAWTVQQPVIAPPSGCAQEGELHGHFEFTAPKAVVDLEGDCDLDKKTGLIFVHHAKLNFNVTGKVINAKTDDHQTDITSIQFTSLSDAVVTGMYQGQTFTVTLHDGGKGKDGKLNDTLRLQWGAYDTGTMTQKHGDVSVDVGK